MAFKRQATSGGGFEPAPEGTHLAVCSRLVDMGTQPTSFGDKRRIQLGFEIDEPREDGQPFMAFGHYTYSTHAQSNLRKLLESWRGKRYEDGEEIDIGGILGKSCLLTLVKDGDYTNIESVAPLMKGMTPLAIKGEAIVFDCDEPDLGEFDKLSDTMKQKIQNSPEYRKAMGKPTEMEEAAAGTTGPGYGEEFDDDIPF